MKILDRESFHRARDFMKAKARPVDAAMFSYLFEGGAADAVWRELSRFANADGGFGRAIEPDCRVPESSALGTITAFPYLVQTHAPATHPLVRNGLHSLQQTYDHTLQGWAMLPEAANEHPRAVWWNYDAERTDNEIVDHWINPSASILADLQTYAAIVPVALIAELKAKALRELDVQPMAMNGQEFLCMVELAEALPAVEAAPFWSRLKSRARHSLLIDPAQWSAYGVRPLWAVSGPQSPLMDELAESVAAQLDFELAAQQPDGSWHPFWSWGRYEEVWPIAKLEWQGALTLKALKSLKAFGRIPASH